jgi:FixJ family two-component response regulator
MMPMKTGLDLQNDLRATGHNIPIIFITAVDNEDVLASAYRGGAYCVLPKPYSEDSLIHGVTKALGAYRPRG